MAKVLLKGCKSNPASSNILSIDLGTSRVKVVLFNEIGDILARIERSYPLDIQPGGKVEQSPRDWINAVVECTSELAAIGSPTWPPCICSITGQMHGMVLLDSAKELVRPAMICSDFRANEELAEIETLLSPEYIIRTTGSPGIAMMPGPKMLWIKKHEPRIYEKIRYLLLPKDYIGFQMTGEIATDPSDASGTMFYNVVKRDWDEMLCNTSAMSIGVLPPILPAESLRGEVTKEFYKLSGIPAGTPVIVGGGDLPTTVLGAGVLSENEVSVSLGTAGIISRLAPSLQDSVLGRIFYFCHVIPDMLVSMGSCPATGFSINWFENQILKSNRHQGRILGEVKEIKLKEPPDLYYLPFILGTGSPYMDYTSQGAFLGLSHHHHQEDLRRALLEGIAYSLRQSLELLQAGRKPAGHLIANAGGSYNLDWVQILANIFGLPMHTLVQKDTAVVGAGILGAFSAGMYSSLEDASRNFVREEMIIYPEIDSLSFYDIGYKKYIGYCGLLSKMRNG